SCPESVPGLGEVIGGVEQAIDFGGIGEFDLDHPGAVVRVAVHQARIVVQRRIDSHNFAAHAAVEVAGGFDRFDLTEGFAGRDFRTDLGERDVGDVGELVGGDLGDADGGGVAVDLVPFVRFEVLAIG